MTDKFPEELRTFETRLEFLNSIFSDLYQPVEIMSSCVRHKLDRSYLAYIENLHIATLNLSCADPLKVLKNLE